MYKDEQGGGSVLSSNYPFPFRSRKTNLYAFQVPTNNKSKKMSGRRSARGASTSSSSSSSSIGHQSNIYQFNTDLTTDLNLGLSISSTQSIIPRGDHNWASSALNPTVVGEGGSDQNEKYYNCNGNRLYVKVYMEGHPIGRKLDILSHHGYSELITTLDHMFNTNILWGAEVDADKCEDFHVLTYEDEEGDWLMVGDVPWEMFLSAVKRLKISRACPC